MNSWDNFKNKLGTILAVVIGLLTLGFFFERNQKENLESELLNKDVKDKDKELKEQGDALEAKNKQIAQQAVQEKSRPMTEQETVEFLNRINE